MISSSRSSRLDRIAGLVSTSSRECDIPSFLHSAPRSLCHALASSTRAAPMMGATRTRRISQRYPHSRHALMDVALIVLVVCSVLAGAFGSFVGMYLSRLALFEYLVSHSNLSEIVYTSTLTGEQVVASEADPTGFGTCICFFDRNSSVCQAAAEAEYRGCTR